MPTSPLPVHIAVVLYEFVRQRIGPERRVLLWVTKCAEEAGILARHGLEHWSFTKPVLSDAHRALTKQYLTSKGTIPGNMSMTFFVRTNTPVPAEWEQLVTDAERSAFATAFQTRIADRAAEKAVKRDAARK